MEESSKMTIWRIVYVDRKNQSDHTITDYTSETKEQACSKFEKMKYSLSNKPLLSTMPRVFTEEEFAQLKKYYIVFEMNGINRFCLIYALTKDEATAEFPNRFYTEPKNIYDEAEFLTTWPILQQSNTQKFASFKQEAVHP